MDKNLISRLQTILIFLFNGTKSGATVELVSDVRQNYIYTCFKGTKNELSVTDEEIAILLYNDLIEIDSGFGLGLDSEREVYQLTEEASEKIEDILKNIEKYLALPV